MSSLGFSSRDLEIEGWLDNVTHKTFHLLCNFLQPDTALTLKTTAESILNLLPEEDSYSTDVSSFGNTCIDLAEQIPYHHPSQLKLADLLEYLASSMKFSQICESKVSA